MSDTGPDLQDLAYTIPEAVKVAKISRPTIYRLAAKGELRLTHIGGRTLIRRAELEALLERHEEGREAA